MKNRFIRSMIFFAVALALVPFLPLYVERTFMRSWRVDRRADEIRWGWKLVSLPAFWSNYNYMARDQQPALWLKLDLALAVVYALILAVLFDQLLAWFTKRRNKAAHAAGSTKSA